MQINSESPCGSEALRPCAHWGLDCTLSQIDSTRFGGPSGDMLNHEGLLAAAFLLWRIDSPYLWVEAGLMGIRVKELVMVAVQGQVLAGKYPRPPSQITFSCKVASTTRVSNHDPEPTSRHIVYSNSQQLTMLPFILRDYFDNKHWGLHTKQPEVPV